MDDASRRDFLKQTGLTTLAALGVDLVSQWASNESDRHRILAENPETLYGFKKGA